MLAQNEELDNIVRGPSTHKREGASLRPSWDAHSSNRDTHGLEGPRAWHLKRSGSEWEKLVLCWHRSLGAEASG